MAARRAVAMRLQASAKERLRRFKPYPAYKESGVEWLGKIPAHWEPKRLKTVAFVQLSNVDKKSLEGQEPVRLCNYVDVYYNERITGNLEFMAATATPEQIRRFALRAGDVLITKDSESWTDIAVPAVVAEDLPGVLCGYHLAHIRPGEQCDGAFLNRSFAAIGPRDQFQVAANGITRFGLGGDAIRSGLFAMPPLGEQRAIAEFLDRETARIDALVAKKERLIELLQEKRTALITRAVTKGLDPNVPMKDSGVEWLGEIPVHWEVKPFTKCVVEKSDYRGKTPAKVPSGVFLVTARNVRMGLIDYECSQEFVAENEYDDIMRRGLPKKGDILFTTEAPLGNVALVDREDVALAQRIIRFRMNAVRFDSRFTLFAMMSNYFQVQLATLSTGSTAEGLKASKLPMLRLVSPPLSEQYAIAASLERDTAKIDGLVANIRKAIERLKELRTGLISAAVTGKIDVREEVA
jgi:type I restriction enzyme, S subunit